MDWEIRAVDYGRGPDHTVTLRNGELEASVKLTLEQMKSLADELKAAVDVQEARSEVKRLTAFLRLNG